MKDLYRGFKKVAEDERSAKLQHENGHELTIAKSGLNKSMKKMLENLPLHQANGTETDKSVEELQAEMQAAKENQPLPQGPQYSGESYKQPEQPSKPEESVGYQIGQVVGRKIIDPIYQGVADTAKAYGKMGSAVAGVAGDIGSGMLNLPQSQPQPQISPAQAALTPPAEPQLPSPTEPAPATLAPTERKVSAEATPSRQEQMDAAMASLQTPSEQALTPSGVPKTAPAVAKQPTMTDEAILESPTANLVDKQQAVTRIYQKTLKDLTQKAEEERQKIKEIDPNRLWNNLSTWGKVRNTIGLILGGIGGGLTHQENPAMRALDRMIEQDVEAQKQDNSNRTNLYKFHLDRLKDSQAAYEATMKNLKDVVMNQMEIDMGMMPGKPIYKQALRNKQLAMQNDELEQLQKRAALQTQNLWANATPKGKTLAQQDPAIIANQIKMEKEQRDSLQKEISRRKQIKQNAPLIMQKLDQVLSDYSGLGGIVKTPDSVKDLEIMIRGLIPDVAGDKDGTAKEATVQQFVKLLKPEGKFDVMFSDPQSFKNRATLWLTQNLTGSPVAGGMTLNDFDQTRIDPSTWATPGETNSVKIRVNGKEAAIPRERLQQAQQQAQQLGFKLEVLQ